MAPENRVQRWEKWGSCLVKWMHCLGEAGEEDCFQESERNTAFFPENPHQCKGLGLGNLKTMSFGPTPRGHQISPNQGKIKSMFPPLEGYVISLLPLFLVYITAPVESGFDKEQRKVKHHFLYPPPRRENGRKN